MNKDMLAAPLNTRVLIYAKWARDVGSTDAEPSWATAETDDPQRRNWVVVPGCYYTTDTLTPIAWAPLPDAP